MSPIHTDTTSISVYGDYESEEEGAIYITFGLPKNSRWDLKQFVLSLIVNQQGILFFMNMHSGNAPDKITIMEVIKSLKSSLTPENKVYYVADNSFYMEDNIKKMGKTFWIVASLQQLLEQKNYLLQT